jgi:hypothetical protein
MTNHTKYEMISKWGGRTGSYADYIEDQQKLAMEEGAPVTAIYKRSGKWVLAGDVGCKETREWLLAGDTRNAFKSKVESACIPFIAELLKSEAVQFKLELMGNNSDLDNAGARMHLASLMAQTAPLHIMDFIDDIYEDLYSEVTAIQP